MDYKDILEVDHKKVAILKSLHQGVLRGDLSYDDMSAALKEENLKYLPEEISYVEQELSDEGVSDGRMIAHNLEIFNLYEPYIERVKMPKISSEHPLALYRKENEAMKSHLNEGTMLMNRPFHCEEWYALACKLQAYRVHFQRKQNQLYPQLSEHGFNRPQRIMWSFDDEVSSSLEEFLKTTEDGQEKAIFSAFTVMRDLASAVMSKEELVIYPTAFKLIALNEFLKMADGDYEIGYAFIDPPNYDEEESAMMQGLESLMIHHDGQVLSNETEIQLTKGKMTLCQLNLMLRHLPFDISFIDEKELVCFYNDRNDRIMKRSPGFIGRDVKRCFSRDNVRAIVETMHKFRTGEEDEIDFWLNKDERFVHIRYIAVRDKMNRFRGVIELVEDVSDYQGLCSNQTFIEWNK